MAVSKISSAVEVPKNMMTLTGIWPYQSPPTIWYRTKNCFSYISLVTLFSLMTVEVAVTEDIISLSDILFLYFQFVAYIVKLVNFHWNKQKFFSISVTLQDPAMRSYELHHNKYVKDAIWRSNFIGNAFRYACAANLVVLSLKPFIGKDPFPVPFSFFQQGYMWSIVYVVQVVSLVTGLDVLCIGYMGIAIAELDILTDKLRNFTDTKKNNSEDVTEEYLRSCCYHHDKIIEYIKSVDEVFNKGIFAQCFSSIIVTCNSGFRLLITPLFSTEFVGLVAFFLATMIELAMYCWFGNEIILKSLEIGDACYMSRWYEFGPRIKKMIFLVMERAKRPLHVSAYKFAFLSLPTYTAVIRWAYSYFTLLRRLYAKDTEF